MTIIFIIIGVLFLIGLMGSGKKSRKSKPTNIFFKKPVKKGIQRKGYVKRQFKKMLK